MKKEPVGDRRKGLSWHPSSH